MRENTGEVPFIEQRIMGAFEDIISMCILLFLIRNQIYVPYSCIITTPAITALTKR